MVSQLLGYSKFFFNCWRTAISKVNECFYNDSIPANTEITISGDKKCVWKNEGVNYHEDIACLFRDCNRECSPEPRCYTDKFVPEFWVLPCHICDAYFCGLILKSRCSWLSGPGRSEPWADRQIHKWQLILSSECSQITCVLLRPLPRIPYNIHEESSY